MPSIAECAEAGRKYALLMGINEYSGGSFAPLEGCRNDIRLIRDLLTQERFGFASDDITILLDAQAAHNGILGAIDTLAEKVGRDDIVYIHYSGHGSRATDMNGDERQETGEDSTLVSYGSRSGSGSSGATGNEGRSVTENLDDYDILDDELETALARLANKTQNLVFVADACHSGTITRGDSSMATRGIEADSRPHPAGDMTPLDPNAKRSWVAVGAAQVSEKAVEYLGDDKQKYGAFTWFWVRALQSTTGEDTWQMVYERVGAMMRGALSRQQNPSFEGNVLMKVFGGLVEEIPKKFIVTSTFPVVRLNVGTFAGVADKSEFRVEKESVLTNTRLIVQKADAYTCEVSVEGGAVKAGDVAVLTKWQPSFSPLKVALQADFPSDEPLLSQLRDLFSGDRLPAYELADSPGTSHMVLWLTRPMKDEKGNIVLEEGSALPKVQETVSPEVWVMDPSQAYLYNKREDLKVPLDEEGLKILARNLDRLGRLHGLYAMRLPEGGDEKLTLEYKLFVPASEEEWSALSDDKREQLTRAPKDTPLKWKLNRIVPANDPEVELQTEEGLLQVRVDNQSDQPYHIYGINATSDAKILPFLPRVQSKLTEVKPGQVREFDDSLVLTEEQEYVRVIATLNPINIHILEQSAMEAYKAYCKKEKSQSESNPIEAMFRQQLYPTRGESAFSGFAPAEISSKGTNFLKNTR
jgi:hypothetical protein